MQRVCPCHSAQWWCVESVSGPWRKKPVLKKYQEKKSLSNRYNINKRIDTHAVTVGRWRAGQLRTARRVRRRRWWWEEVVVVRGWQATTGVIVTATRQCREALR